MRDERFDKHQKWSFSRKISNEVTYLRTWEPKVLCTFFVLSQTRCVRCAFIIVL